jgi:hypothetical protein
MEKVIKPNIEGEMDEFQRISQDLRRNEKIDVSVEELVRAFEGLKEQTLTNDIWEKLENTESNEIVKDDWKAVYGVAKMYKKTNPEVLKKSFQKGDYKRPLILKMRDRYILIAGNTRLCTAAAMGINPKVFIGEIGEEVDVKDLINKAHKDITRTKGKEYAPDHNEIQKWIDDKLEVSESEELKGGNADNKSLIHIAKKHDAKGYYHIDNMVQSLKKELEMGIEIEMEHTDDKDKAKEIAMDHLWEDPSYYSKLKKSGIEKDEKETNEASNPAQQAAIAINMKKKGIEPKSETKEQTMASSSGSYEGNAFGPMIKREIKKLNNADLTEQEQEIDEVTDASSSGAFDVPAFGKTTKGGRKNPLKIDGPDSIYKGRAVKDKNFPKWGGPDSVFVKVKEKCKKFPYCNQGNTGAIELVKEDQELREAITQTSEKYGIPYKELEKIVLNEINKIFI